MKKLFFSAVALVAFSSVLMANIVIEDKTVKEKDNSIHGIVILGIDCNEYALERVNKVEETQGCLTPTQYTFYYNDCMRKKVLNLEP